VTIQILPVEGIGEAVPGDDVATLVLAGLDHSGIELLDRDIVVITHKLVSKAEGAVVDLADDGPDGHRELVEREAAAILRRRGSLVIAETRHGFVCANAGVDRSNIANGKAVLLPRDPDASAHRARIRLERAHGVSLGVVVTDTFGRAWRHGLTDVAIGVSGIPAILDFRGSRDTAGNILEVTEVAIVDEIAAAADLVMGKASGIPAAVIRGLDLEVGDGRATDLVRAPHEDLFR
jgi:coenzyme F420-0:L-glutamate ligase/coenzyme F420-1:gamma-L-glutamate ligase